MNKINNIIKEEIQGFLKNVNEKIEFKQQVIANFWNYNGFSSDYDIQIDSAQIILNWSVNSQNINGFSVNINGVEGFYLVKYLDRQTDEIVQENNKNIKDDDWKFEIEGKVILQVGVQIFAKELQFDFNNNLCKVIF